MKALTLIADIVKSKEIEERKTFQETLGELLEKLNQESADNIASPYTITLGDEFQAVYNRFDSVFQDIFYILWRLYPVKIRFAFNYDIINTNLNKKTALGMDGPAFHGARSLLTELKQKDETIIQVNTTELLSPDLINATLKAFSKEINNWPQTALGVMYYSLKGYSVKDMISRLSVKQRAIYKSIETNHIREYEDVLKAIESDFHYGMDIDYGE